MCLSSSITMAIWPHLVWIFTSFRWVTRWTHSTCYQGKIHDSTLAKNCQEWKSQTTITWQVGMRNMIVFYIHVKSWLLTLPLKSSYNDLLFPSFWPFWSNFKSNAKKQVSVGSLEIYRTWIILSRLITSVQKVIRISRITA